MERRVVDLTFTLLFLSWVFTKPKTSLVSLGRCHGESALDTFLELLQN